MKCVLPLTILAISACVACADSTRPPSSPRPEKSPPEPITIGDLEGACSRGACEEEPPELEVLKPRLIFGRDASRRQNVKLRNGGEGALEITSLRVTEDDDVREFRPTGAVAERYFDALEGGATVTLAPGAVMEFAITWSPVNERPDRGFLVIGSNDPARPEATVELISEDARPRIVVVDDFALPETPAGQTSEGMLEVTNGGVAPLEILEARFVAVEDEVFTVDFPASIRLYEGESAGIPVRFVPGKPGSFGEVLQLTTNDPEAATTRVFVNGQGQRGVPEGCIDVRAVARVAQRGEPGSQWVTEVRPGDRIELSAEYGGQARPAQLTWALIASPPGSMARVDGERERTLRPDVLGRYVVELTAEDRDGDRECSAQRIIIDVEDCDCDTFRVEYAREVALDPEPLELHYRRVPQAWNQPPYDVYWGNPSPVWHVGGSNPIWRQEGAMQIIEHDGPAAGVYEVGVYFGYRGESRGGGTVRVYMDEALVEERALGLTRGEFALIGAASWPAGIFEPSEVRAPGFPR